MSLRNVGSRRSARGFSMIELMIAIVIIGIVATIAVQAYEGYVDTAAIGVIHQKIDGLRVFQENYRIDSGTNSYFAGTYDPSGINDFDAELGYRMGNDDDGIRLVVTACDGGAIENCFKITATDREGRVVVWNDGNYLP